MSATMFNISVNCNTLKVINGTVELYNRINVTEREKSSSSGEISSDSSETRLFIRNSISRSE